MIRARRVLPSAEGAIALRLHILRSMRACAFAGLALMSLAALATLAPSAARGAVIAADDPVFGPGSITRDLETGLEWLDLTFTMGITVREIRPMVEPGGAFFGWRRAETSEVLQLFADAGIPDIDTPMVEPLEGWTWANYRPVRALVELLGFTGDGCFNLDCPYSAGRTATHPLPDRTDLVEGASVQYCVDNCGRFDHVGRAQVDEIAFREDYDPDNYGHWLVRGGPVPIHEPPAFLLLALAATAVALFRRRFSSSAASR